MRIFGADSTRRGCFIRFDLNTEKSQGAVLSVPKDSESVLLPTITAGSDYLPFVITGVSFTKSENLSHQLCFNERVYTYTFGEKIGNLQVQLVAFLTSGVVNLSETGTLGSEEAASSVQGTGGDESDAVKTMLDVYDKGRISVSKQEAVLSLGSTGSILSGQLMQLVSGTRSTEDNTQTFQLTMAVLPEPKRDPNRIVGAG